MRSVLLYLVIALFAWMGFALFGGSGSTTLTPGFLLLMACLSVLLWERAVVPMMHRTGNDAAQARPVSDRPMPPRAADAPVRRQAGTPARPAPAWRPLPA